VVNLRFLQASTAENLSTGYLWWSTCQAWGASWPTGGSVMLRLRSSVAWLLPSLRRHGLSRYLWEPWCSYVPGKAVQGGERSNVRPHRDGRLTGHDRSNIRPFRSPGTFDWWQNLTGQIVYRLFDLKIQPVMKPIIYLTGCRSNILCLNFDFQSRSIRVWWVSFNSKTTKLLSYKSLYILPENTNS